jgi:hypothetical protein
MQSEPHFVALAARHHCERVLSPGYRRGFFIAKSLIAFKRAGAAVYSLIFRFRMSEKLKKGGI